MDYAEYKRRYFTDPPPPQRHRFVGSFAVALYYEEFEGAVSFYQRVLGPPAYAEGEGSPRADALMYEPVRSCPVRDPFGTEILIAAPLSPHPR